MADLSSWARSVPAQTDTRLLIRDMEYLLLDEHRHQRDALASILAETMTAVEASRHSADSDGLGPAWRGPGSAPLMWTMVGEGIALVAIILGFAIQFGGMIEPTLAFPSAPLVVVVSAVVGSISAWATEMLRVKDKGVGNDPVALHITYAVLTAATAALGWVRPDPGTEGFHEGVALWPLVLVACVVSHLVLTVVGLRHQERLVGALESIRRMWSQAARRSEKPIAEIFDQAERRSVASLKGLPAATAHQLLAQREKIVGHLMRRGILDKVGAAVVSESPLGCARISVERAYEEGRWEQPAPNRAHTN